MKIAFLIECTAEKEAEIKKSLSPQGFSFIKTKNPEEIIQTGTQLGHVVLCFADSAVAYKFLKQNNFSSFSTLNLLFMAVRPKISEDAGKKLKEVALELVTFSDAALIEKLLHKTESSEDVEIEFLVNVEDKKDAA